MLFEEIFKDFFEKFDQSEESSDGYYCEKCGGIHPTPFWHDLYDEYLKPIEEYIPFIKEINTKISTDEEAAEEYVAYMEFLELERCDEAGECAACGAETHYRHTLTNLYVCSDKCKYNVNR